MKKTTLTTVVCLFCMSIFAQHTFKENQINEANQLAKEKAAGKLLADSVLNYYLDETPIYKTTFEYDKEGRKTTEINYFYNEALQKWDKLFKDTYSYDEKNRLTINITYDFIDDKEWREGSYRTSMCDERNDIIQEVYKFWDMNTNEWVIGSKDTIVYTYNENNLLTVRERKTFNYEENRWKLSYRDILSYDASGYNTRIDNWGTNIDKEEELLSCTNYINDDRGNHLSSIFSIKDTDTDQFEEVTKTIYAYDSGSRITLFEYYKINPDHSLSPSRKIEYTYDENGNPLLEYYSEPNFSFDGWEKTDYMKYFYSDPIGIKTALEQYIYATSCAQGLTLHRVKKGSLIEIYTMDGKLISKQMATEQQTEVPLPTGIYLLKVDNQRLKVIVY